MIATNNITWQRPQRHVGQVSSLYLYFLTRLLVPTRATDLGSFTPNREPTLCLARGVGARTERYTYIRHQNPSIYAIICRRNTNPRKFLPENLPWRRLFFVFYGYHQALEVCGTWPNEASRRHINADPVNKSAIPTSPPAPSLLFLPYRFTQQQQHSPSHLQKKHSRRPTSDLGGRCAFVSPFFVFGAVFGYTT